MAKNKIRLWTDLCQIEMDINCRPLTNVFKIKEQVFFKWVVITLHNIIQFTSKLNILSEHGNLDDNYYQ